jgi:hypothetical protein
MGPPLHFAPFGLSSLTFRSLQGNATIFRA